MSVTGTGENSAADISATPTAENQDSLVVKKAHTEQRPAAAIKVAEKAVNAKEEKKKREERIR